MAKASRSGFVAFLVLVASALLLLAFGSALREGAPTRQAAGGGERAGSSKADRALVGPGRCVSRRFKRVDTTRIRRRCAHKPASAAGPAQPLYWGAWDGDQLTGEEAPFDPAAITAFAKVAGRVALAGQASPPPFADCSGGGECPLLRLPDRRDGSGSEKPGAIPLFSWALELEPRPTLSSSRTSGSPT